MRNNMLMAMAISAILVLSGCGDNDAPAVIAPIVESPSDGEGNGTGGISDTFKVMTMDASDRNVPGRLNLTSGEVVTDDSWHFTYQRFVGFSVNGGTSGEGNVSACAAYEYDALFDTEGNAVQAEFEKLTASSTQATFKAVKKEDCNASQFKLDSINTHIKTSSWLSADYQVRPPVFSASTDANNSWIIRSASADAYARVKVEDVTVVFGRATTRKITLSSEKWNGATFNAAVSSPVLDFTNDRIYWDLETNDIVGVSDDWDLSIRLDGRSYALQLNGGASGSGRAGAGLIMRGFTTATVTDPTNRDQVFTYFSDRAEGAMSEPGSFGALQYNVANTRKMWPTFTVYIFKDGEDYYKAQVISNHGEDGSLGSGHISVRYEKLP